MRCTSSIPPASWTCSRRPSTISGPIVIGGTKWPSITSTWITRAPASITSRTRSPSWEKSVARIEGATRRSRSSSRASVTGVTLQEARAAALALGEAAGGPPAARRPTSVPLLLRVLLARVRLRSRIARLRVGTLHDLAAPVGVLRCRVADHVHLVEDRDVVTVSAGDRVDLAVTGVDAVVAGTPVDACAGGVHLAVQAGLHVAARDRP